MSSDKPRAQDALLDEQKELVEQIWRTLKYSSLMLIGPKGIGKTYILEHVIQNRRNNFKPIYINANHDRENLDSVRKSLIEELSVVHRNYSLIGSIFKSSSLQTPRNSSLSKLASKVANSLDDNEFLLLVLDDFTELLNSKNEIESRQLMDELRHLRMTNDKIRMVVSGRNIDELGLQYSDVSFFNDLKVLTVEALSKKSTKKLISQLIKTSENKKYLKKIINLMSPIDMGYPIIIKTIFSLLDSRFKSDRLELTSTEDLKFELDAIIERMWKNVTSRLTDDDSDELENIAKYLSTHKHLVPEENLIKNDRQRNYLLKILEQEGFIRRSNNNISFTHKVLEDWVNSHIKNKNYQKR
ncbi:ATP-binding protein [Alteromonas sp. CI.11.F.A3]|uniref:ATP-binding protein n=1 Tax=Alteromonas sp. CI.11.F.A3 TaxID=3079555 RepID=UPI0029424C56|nr:ATP-binding protein [Alteromonas sp. CI.11.F.A3]WOI37778.1 ATP-binding protein [Alteromonas sp. CI.11.F.A3]